jgi:succinate-acetate transporter protein
MNNRSVSTATIGFMCLALAGWMISMPAAGWFEKVYPHGIAITASLAILLVIMGILAFVHGRALDCIIFFGGAGFFWSAHLYGMAGAQGGAAEPGSYGGWYFFVWTLFFAWVWLGSFKAELQRMLFLLGLWLTLLALAIGQWTGIHGFTLAGGYLGLITSILAAITSAVEVIGHGRDRQPNDDGRAAAHAHPAAAEK